MSCFVYFSYFKCILLYFLGVWYYALCTIMLFPPRTQNGKCKFTMILLHQFLIVAMQERSIVETVPDVLVLHYFSSSGSLHLSITIATLAIDCYQLLLACISVTIYILRLYSYSIPLPNPTRMMLKMTTWPRFSNDFMRLLCLTTMVIVVIKMGKQNCLF